MEILFMAPRFDSGKTPTKKATIQVTLNGFVLHDRVGLDGPTGGQGATASGTIPDTKYHPIEDGWTKAVAPFVLQEHDNQIEFRSITIDPTYTFSNSWQRGV